MVKRGRLKYVPRNVLDEIEILKSEEKTSKDVVAFNKMVEHARVGRELEKVYTVWNPFLKKKRKRK